MSNTIKYLLAVGLTFAMFLATGYGIYANRDRGYVLTMVVVFYGQGNPTSATTIQVDYSTTQACEAAKVKNTKEMKIGQLVLASCTAK